MSETLGDAFPRELARARLAIKAYEDCGPVGGFALSWIRPLVAESERAWNEQDTVAMVRLYPELQGIKL